MEDSNAWGRLTRLDTPSDIILLTKSEYKIGRNESN
jgi:hypothetical protein